MYASGMTRQHLREMSDTEIAWFAGLFEGEGSIVQRHSSGSSSYAMVIGMTDADVIAKAVAVTGVGGGTAPTDRSARGWKTIYWWRIGHRYDTVPLATAIRPYMGTRRQAAIDEMLAWAATAKPRARKGVCDRGHVKEDRDSSGRLKVCKFCIGGAE